MNVSEYMSLVERIQFSKGGECIAWECSYDDGQTWTPVEWEGQLPFFRLRTFPEAPSSLVLRRVEVPAIKEPQPPLAAKAKK